MADFTNVINSSINVPTAVGPGTALNVQHLAHKSVAIYSVAGFTATYQVQLSNDPSSAPNAASFINEGNPVTNAPGLVEVTKPCVWIRVSCTAYTSGSPLGKLCGIAGGG